MHILPLLLLGLMATMPAGTALAREWSAAEVRAMPPYCAGRYARHDNPTEYNRWETIYGADFLHTHHLCDAFGYLNRYPLERHAQKKKSLLQSALGNLNYFIPRAAPASPLLPTALLTRAKVFILQQQIGAALADALRALELDRQLVDAYVLSADIHAKSKRQDEALAVITEGLRHVPGNARLQRLYDQYGGKQPYPEPISPAAERPTPVASDRKSESVKKTDSAKPQVGPAATNTPEAMDSTQAPVGDASKSSAPPMGIPGNPWCRFCPETTMQ